jgi:NAD(P)-dependent dehydrogenase (short-subunit alcohol dehydrogenase family)
MYTLEPFDLIDTALDRTIVLGFSRPGMLLRRRGAGWPPDPPRIDGKVVLVTGAASGIGRSSCIGFARLGATVLAVARSRARADDAARAVLASVPDASVRPLACDLSRLDELDDFSRRLRRDLDRLDVLVNNAGVMPERRERSADGHELMFATHVLAPFALTAWTRELLQRSAPARVINVSSGGMYTQPIRAGDPESERDRYSAKKLYARTKRELVVISEEWAKRLHGTGIVVHAMHPGWADTTGVRRAMPTFRKVIAPIIRSPEQGADTVVWLGAAPEPLKCTGGFWHDRRRRPTEYALGADGPNDLERQALWGYCQATIDAVRR